MSDSLFLNLCLLAAGWCVVKKIAHGKSANR
jgi:hypothetical protein